MIKVNHHSSATIIQSEKQNNFMFHIYDATYPRAVWRECYNLIGGNFNPLKKTNSPMELLTQELKEEFRNEQDSEKVIEKSLTDIVGEGYGAKKVKVFAPSKNIKSLLGYVLESQPYQDFIYRIPVSTGKNFTSISSVFHAFVPPELFELARNHVLNGREIRNEGITGFATADDLVSGKVRMAWHAGKIMEEYLGKCVPNPHRIDLIPIGLPMDSFIDYTKIFEYHKPVL